MKPFQFRFETVLDLRKREEDQVREAMAPLIGELGKINTMMEASRQGLAAWNRDKNRLITDAGNISLYTSAMQTFQGSLSRLDTEKAKVETSLAPWRERLGEAIRKRKALEVLKDRDLVAWKEARRKAEAREIEEIAATRHAVKQSGLSMLF